MYIGCYKTFEKIQKINNLNKEFVQSKGEKHDQINPTIRSKIIFGIAYTMKRLYANNTFLYSFFGSACSDNQLESLIKLQIRAYFDTSKADLVPSILYKVPNERLKEVLEFFLILFISWRFLRFCNFH